MKKYPFFLLATLLAAVNIAISHLALRSMRMNLHQFSGEDSCEEVNKAIEDLFDDEKGQFVIIQ